MKNKHYFNVCLLLFVIILASTFVLAIPSNFSVTLDYPVSGLNFTSHVFTFYYNSTPNGGGNVTNSTLFLWFIDGTLISKTLNNSISNKTISYNAVGSFANGAYKWNVLACGNNISGDDSPCMFAFSNSTFNISFVSGNFPISCNSLVDVETKANCEMLESAGAGTSSFLGYLTESLPSFLIGFVIIAFVVSLGFGIKILIKKFAHSHK